MAQSPEYRRLVRLAAGFNRKARAIGAYGRITAQQLYLLEYEQQTCAYCGISLEIGQGSFDHVVPLDRGGPNSFFNLVRSCFTCNRTKFTKRPDELAVHRDLIVTCSVCGKPFRPRWAEYQAGRARVCSRSCAARRRWLPPTPTSPSTPT